MKKNKDFEEIVATKEMVIQADLLLEGPILIIYKDQNDIRMETIDGIDPYVWRDNKWRKMVR